MNENRWNNLSMRDRAELIKLGVSNGITDLSFIRDVYNKYDGKTESTQQMDIKNDAAPTSNNSPLEVEVVYNPNTGGQNVSLKHLNSRRRISYNPKFMKNIPADAIQGSRSIDNFMAAVDAERNMPKEGIEYIEKVRHPERKELNNGQINLLNARKAVFKEKARQQNEQAKKLSKAKLKKVQQDLVDGGYYTQVLKTFNTEQVKHIQKKKNIKVDGIVGPQTIKAFNELSVDGIYGKNTKQAITFQASSYKDIAENKVPSNIDGCAAYVTSVFNKVTGDTSKACGVWGNAWTMPKNIENAGGTMVYNLYDNEEFNNIDSIYTLSKATRSSSKNHQLDYSTINQGDIIGIYMPGSKYLKTALETGSTYNTHVGYVVGYDYDDMPLISHNVSGKYRTDRADKLSGSKNGKPIITTVTRPKDRMNSTLPQVLGGMKHKSSRFEINRGSGKDFPAVMDGMETVADLVQEIFPAINVEDAMIEAIAVQQRETKFGKNRESDQLERSGKFSTKYVQSEVEKLARKVMGKDPKTKSSNQMKMKFNALANYERSILGINSPKDLEDPTKAGAAALYLMSRNMNYFKKLQATYPDLGITDEDIKYLTALSYNQGIGSLKDIGFDKFTGEARPEELEKIRWMAEPDSRIHDYSSTKWRYLGKKAGKFMYETFEDPFKPYIASAREARGNIKRKSEKKSKK